MLLGDLGASVIKVERTGKGDETREWGPPFDASGESAYYLSINRNKLSVALDLDIPADLSVLRSLIDGADVVLDNFLPGTLEKRGIDPTTILEDSPDMIWCTITGFGQGSSRPGYDFVIQAESGWMAINGEPDGKPLRTGVALADLIAGKDAAIAILAALVQRGREPGTRVERRVWISLAHSATASLVNVAQNSLVSGSDARRWGNAHPNLVPYQTFEAEDRTIVIAVGSDKQWRKCAEVLGLNELRDDAALSTNAGRLEHRSRLVSDMQRAISAAKAQHWIHLLDAAGIPCGIVRTVLEALQDVDASPLTGISPAIPGSVRFSPPKLDEHGAGIREQGWKYFAKL
jgi:crotonobetainyl-CoA:carnitine CoA-transferase CaiB-like acyl-CoA transferase